MHILPSSNIAMRFVWMGQQKGSLAKVLHAFERADAVIFVANLASYCQGTALLQSLELFDQLVNSRWLQRASFFLFLNKRDLFRDMLSHVPLSACFPEYGTASFEGGDVSAAEDFVCNQFLRRNRSGRLVRSQFMVATDSVNSVDLRFFVNGLLADVLHLR